MNRILNRKVIIVVAAVAVAGGAYALSTGVSNASENCTGLDQSLRQTLDFMADQRAHPNAQTAAVIQNRQAVVDLLNLQRRQAGCTAAVTTSPSAATPTKAHRQKTASAAPTSGTGAGQVVCRGDTVTLSGEAGAPAASSGTFPIGTVLKVTNLDNNRSITVTVTEPSGSCALLNNAAFEQVREPGKFLIRHATVEKLK